MFFIYPLFFRPLRILLAFALVGSLICSPTALIYTAAGIKDDVGVDFNIGTKPPLGAEISLPVAPQIVVEVWFSDRTALNRAAARLDIWEVNQEAQYFIAAVNTAEMDWLSQAGYSFSVQPQLTAKIQAPPDYPCYRTVDQLYTDLSAAVQAYPNLASLINIGKSYEARDLWVIRLTNAAIASPKPRLVALANVHGREMITPETAMEFMRLLLEGYGKDPDITWLLDWREIYIMPTANPDGHVKNEEYAAYWRKNTHPYDNCFAFEIGVDLNRNFSLKWGFDSVGSSEYPCDDTYRGPSAASEPETSAVQTFISSLFPDQRGPSDEDAAPQDTSGALISLHAYSNLVLWPWGWSSTPAPNADGLAALGNKLASFNGYTASQAISLYPTNGTTDDWSYGELGIASYTFEIGSQDDGFFPTCDRYQNLIQPNLQALLYAAKVSYTPYLTAHGPDSVSLQLSGVGVEYNENGAQIRAGLPVQLTAFIDDGGNGGDLITAAEVNLDLPTLAGGTPLPMSASDGAFDSSTETVLIQLLTNDLETGRHILYVRGQDAQGFWGPVSAIFLWIIEGDETQQVFLPLKLAP